MTTTEVIVAVLLVINVMEAVRRVVSMSLFWVICFFLAYAWFGQYIPGLFRFSGRGGKPSLRRGYPVCA